LGLKGLVVVVVVNMAANETKLKWFMKQTADDGTTNLKLENQSSNRAGATNLQ
jgi:hypothetical protein